MNVKFFIASFEVTIDGKLIFSKLESNGFPVYVEVCMTWDYLFILMRSLYILRLVHLIINLKLHGKIHSKLVNDRDPVYI